MSSSVPPDIISEAIYPKVYGWVDRFRAALSTARSQAPKPASIEGAEAVKRILGAKPVDAIEGADEIDPLGLKPGQEVEVYPSDYGSTHRDRGRLVALNVHEVVIEAQSNAGDQTFRIHCPRVNFRVAPVRGHGASL